MADGWRAVDDYIADKLLGADDALAAALANNEAQGLPPIDVSATQGKMLFLLAQGVPLLPEGEQVGGVVDRDQWQSILHTVSAVNAYRWLYREGLKPGCVMEMLILRRELPRSLAACAEEISTSTLSEDLVAFR